METEKITDSMKPRNPVGYKPALLNRNTGRHIFKHRVITEIFNYLYFMYLFY